MTPCGKVYFATIEAAWLQRCKMVNGPSPRGAHYLSVYFCTECEGWHIGHNYNLLFSRSLCIGEAR